MKALVICFPLLLLLLVCPVTALAAGGDTGTDGNFSWKELSDGTVEVTGYSGPADMIIPGELSGHTVSGIGQMAFHLVSITSVTMPDSVRTIAEGAFAWRSSLTSVTFGSGLEQIGAYAFYETGLVSAALPENLVSIGESAFYRCRNLSAVTFGSKLKTIGAGHSGIATILYQQHSRTVSKQSEGMRSMTAPAYPRWCLATALFPSEMAHLCAARSVRWHSRTAY